MGIALIGTYPPRRCGIATFTANLRQALADAGVSPLPVAALVRDDADAVDERAVLIRIERDRVDHYTAAAAALRTAPVEAVLLQHEYGIFGGADGRHVLRLLAALHQPLITVLHTVLAHPTPGQRDVLREVVARSAAVVVMARAAEPLLRLVYHVDTAKVVHIPHGAPEPPPGRAQAWKAQLGLSGRVVAMTFGLLGPGKGIERMLDAVAIAGPRCPDLLYLVVGATHPEERRARGESYRRALEARVAKLGIGRWVRFIDRYLSEAELLAHLAACDIYVTPYPGAEQICSGTLSYAGYLGKPIISTPYAYARELLGGGAGWLVPFDGTAELAAALSALARAPERRALLAARMRDRCREFGWASVGRRYAELAAAVAGRKAAASSGVIAGVAC